MLDAFPPFTPKLVELIRWAEEYYLVPPGELLRAALPPGLNARKGAAGPGAPRRRVRGARRRRAPDALAGARRARRRSAPSSSTCSRAAASRSRSSAPPSRTAAPALTALARRGLVAARARGAGRARRASSRPPARRRPPLTPAQAAALEAIDGAFGAFAPFLLHGVTGSGKTEVYLQAIARARAAGQGALVLVPEIALTPQLAGRFRARFGDEVALLHSGLSPAERHAEWLRLRRGEARICVGVRSAIFAPVQDLAIVVVDEEHEPSFKQEDGPAYHARDLAVVRGEARGRGVRARLGDAVARDARERAARTLPAARAARARRRPAAARGRARRPRAAPPLRARRAARGSSRPRLAERARARRSPPGSRRSCS